MRYTFTGIILAGFALASCANANSIYRKGRLSNKGASVVSVDARQRFLLANYIEENGGNEPKLRMCAEQFPDIFTVIGASLSATGSIIPGASGAQLQGELATALQESGSSIARTQTINILRESMYRTCERFLIGAISREEFATQAARDNRNMVSVLAIEQLTGSITPPSTVLTFNGNATAAGASAQIQTALESAETDLTAAKEQRDTLKTTYDGTLNNNDACSDLDGGPEGEAQTSCLAARQEYQAAEARVQEQQQQRDILANVAAGFSSATLTGGAQTVGGVNTQHARSYLDNKGAVEAIAEAVVTIVQLHTNQNHLDAVCEALLLREGNTSGSINDSILSRCFDFLTATSEAVVSDNPRASFRELEVDFIVSNDANLDTEIHILSDLIDDNTQGLDPYTTPTFNSAANHPQQIEVTYYFTDDRPTTISVYRLLDRYTDDTICLRKADEDDHLELGFGEIDIYLPDDFARRTEPDTPSSRPPVPCR